MITRRPGRLTDKDRAAFQLLGLADDPASYEVLAVDTAWRQLRTQLHPDKPGGDAAKFDAARKAYEAARFYALEPKPCPECKGAGKLPAAKQRGGFHPVLLFRCGTCQGSGQR